VRLHAAFDLRLETKKLADLSKGEALIKVGAVGICGSDLHHYTLGQIGATASSGPFVLGHEFMGQVVAADRHARSAGGDPLRLGARVAVDPHIACGRCEWCLAGHPNLCPDHTFLGLPGCDGALCEQVVVPARQCHVLPGTISDNAGALLETLGVAIHAVWLAKMAAGKSVLVAGLGPVGLLIVRLAHLAGAHPIIGVDPLSGRTNLARRWGCTDTFTGTVEQLPEKLRTRLGPHGAAISVEAAWAGRAIDGCVQATAPGGRMVLVGIPRDDDCAMTHSVARRKGLTVLFSRRMGHEMGRAIGLASGKNPPVRLDELVTHEWALADAARAYSRNARYARGMIKSVIHPHW